MILKTIHDAIMAVIITEVHGNSSQLTSLLYWITYLQRSKPWAKQKSMSRNSTESVIRKLLVHQGINQATVQFPASFMKVNAQPFIDKTIILSPNVT